MSKISRNQLFRMTDKELEYAINKYYQLNLDDKVKSKYSILPFDTIVEMFNNILYEREIKKYHETIYGS